MKPILIDSIVNDNTSSAFEVDVDGQKFGGWQIAKPLNYDPEYLSMEDRREMANAILEGKAIAVCFFEDLTSEEQSEFVRNKINESAKLKNDNRTLTPNKNKSQ